MTLYFRQDPNPNLTDKLCTKRLKNGDIKAFEQLYGKYGGKLYNFVHSLLYDKNAAEDITQNVFSKLWEKRTALDPEKSVAAYIFMIARHLIYKQTYNRILHKKYDSVFFDGWSEADRSTEEEIDALFLSSHLDTLVKKLPESRRTIFVLSKIEGLSNREIAQKLSISEKTVETQLYRATCFIRKHRL